MWWSRLTGRLEQASVLDPVADGLANAVNAALPARAKDALHGVWLGHQLHPLLVAVPIGLWSGASLLDLTGDKGMQGAARRLVGAGLLAAAPTVASGLADWSSLGLFHPPKRVGLVHAAANTVTAALYGASWLARRSGDQARGRGLALAGVAGLTVGGYLGGHLAYAEGVGVNRNADDAKKPRNWTDAGSEAELTAPGMHRVEVAGQPVLVTQQGGALYAIGARCSHYGAPLDEGELADENGPCVVCPWHGSQFSLADGSVVHGPATVPQLGYDVRVTGGRIQVRVRA